MRRHLPWIVAVAIAGAILLLIAVATRPQSVRAPTATPGASPTAPAALTDAPTGSPATTSPTSAPSARVTPEPGSATLPADAGPTPAGYRPPPDSFDPSSIRWAGDAVTGSSQEKRFGLWTAAIDGSDLQEVVTGEVGTGPVAVGEGTVAFIRVAAGGVTPLFIARPGADPVEAVPWATEIGTAPGMFVAPALTAGRGTGPVDAGVWAVPATGGAATPIAPANDRVACSPELFGERTRAGIAVSDAFVASGVCEADGDAFRLVIEIFDRAADEARTVDVNARPLGFDASRRVIAQSDDGFVALDATTGGTVPVSGEATGQARVTPGGRWLVTYGGGPEVVAHNLASGASERWDIGAPGTFDLTGFGDETRVVLESFAQFPAADMSPGWHIVIDLEEGWLGYLPPIAPFRDDPPE